MPNPRVGVERRFGAIWLPYKIFKSHWFYQIFPKCKLLEWIDSDFRWDKTCLVSLGIYCYCIGSISEPDLIVIFLKAFDLRIGCGNSLYRNAQILEWKRVCPKSKLKNLFPNGFDSTLEVKFMSFSLKTFGKIWP